MTQPVRTTKPGPFAPSIRHSDILNAYARWAPVYDLVFGMIMKSGRQRAVEAIPDDARDIIELGVGTGISLPLHKPGSRVVGVDLSPEMLRCARRLVARRGLSHVEAILEMDICAMDLPDNSFDAAVAMYVVTCVPDAGRMLAEAKRIVRPGGRVIIVSRFAARRGPRAVVNRALTPVGRLLGFNTTVSAESLTEKTDMPLLANRAAGLAGYYRLLEFKVVKDPGDASVYTPSPAP